jgi:hypothetical protein
MKRTNGNRGIGIDSAILEGIVVPIESRIDSRIKFRIDPIIEGGA